MNETRIHQLTRQLEIEMAFLWLTINDDRDEQAYFTARRELRNALHILDGLALRQQTGMANVPPLLLNRLLIPYQTNASQFTPGAEPSALDLRDGLIYELGRSLYILGAPAALQSAIDCYEDGLTNDEILLLIQDWNEAHDDLIGPL